MGSEKSCGVIIYKKIDNELVFLLLKSKNTHSWGFPKGHVEAGETELETARREVYEESGLKIDFIEEIRISTDYIVKTNVNKEVVYFVGTALEGPVKIQPSEIVDYAWANYEQVMRLVSFENLRDVFESAYTYLMDQVDFEETL